MAALPKISIVMPVLNREDTLQTAIDSVLAQNYPYIEFIILDGGSTDRSVDIIRQNSPHLAYWHSQPDGSAALASNIGIAKSTGDLVVLLMADDWYEAETFNRIAEAYQAHPDADMFSCGGRIVDHQKILLSYTTANALQLNFYNICFAVSAICCRFIRKKWYDKVGLYIPFDANAKQFLTNDKEFLLRSVLHNVKDVFVDHLGHTYLAHPHSYSFSNNQKTAIRHCEEHLQIAEDYLKKSLLSLKQKWLLRFWHMDQSARLVLYRLLNKEFKNAWHAAVRGVRYALVFWPFSFCYTVTRILWRRSLRVFS